MALAIHAVRRLSKCTAVTAAAHVSGRRGEAGRRITGGALGLAAVAAATGAAATAVGNSTDSPHPMEQMAVLRAVQAALSSELADQSALDLFASLQALQRWQSRNRSPGRRDLPGSALCPNTRLDSHLLHEAYRMCRYATASYGWKGLVYFWLTDRGQRLDATQMLRTAAIGDGAAFCFHAGIPADCLVYESSSSQIGAPKHFVCVNDANKEILLVIRGTMSVADTFTDILGRHTRFADGEAHEGMAIGAMTVLNNTRPVLLSELRKHPGYSIRVTGHSLGAGTAILVSLLLSTARRRSLRDPAVPSDEVPFLRVPIRCVAFAPPPCFAPLEAIEEDPLLSIRSWVHDEDFISRLSATSVTQLLRLLRRITAAFPSVRSRMFDNLDLRAVLAGAAAGEAESLPGAREGQQRHQHAAERPKLLIPGTIFCFRLPLATVADAMDAERGSIERRSSSRAVAAAAGGSGSSIGSGGIVDGAVNVMAAAFSSAEEVITALSSRLAGVFSVPPSSSESSEPVGSCAAAGIPEGLDAAYAAMDRYEPSPAAAALAAAAAAGAVPAAAISSGAGGAGGGACSPPAGGDDPAGSIGDIARPDSRVEAEVLQEADRQRSPIVTLCSALDLYDVPVTEKTWRDHVPDSYLFTLRTLSEVAELQRRRAAREEAAASAASQPVSSSWFSNDLLEGASKECREEPFGYEELGRTEVAAAASAADVSPGQSVGK